MNGKTSLVGILGWPVAHSKSPAMHNAAFRHLNLNWAYVPLPVRSANEFHDAIRGLVACGFKGANVTVPYKEDASRIVDEISDEVRAIGAANTLIMRQDGTVRAENTDAQGFLSHLTDEKIQIKGKRVAVIGAGGAARAIVFALRQAGVSNLMLINRSKERAEQVAESFELDVFEWSRSSFAKAAATDLVINTTSLGLRESDEMPWHGDVQFSPQQVVYDAIYSRTPFLKKASQDGARTITGAGMLLWQGALAFELWTGVKAPVGVMRQELQDA